MDYTNTGNVFAYGDVQMPTGAQTLLMNGIVTEVSRKIDQHCNMAFGLATYTNQVARAQIDRDGQLMTWLAVPTINSLTVVAWKPGTSTTWTALADLTAIETTNRSDGSLLRVITPTFLAYRGQRMQLRLTYSAGWTAIGSDVPSDFEFIARRLSWWEYKKRDAPMEKTAIPELGVVIIPHAWPDDIKRALRNYALTVAT